MRNTANGTALLSTALDYRPRIIARRDTIESSRRLPEDLAHDLAQAGFFRIFLPAAYGGLDLTPMDGIAVIEELAKADASVAWCVWNGNTHWTAAQLSAEAARAIHDDPTSSRPHTRPLWSRHVVDVGFRLTGRCPGQRLRAREVDGPCRWCMTEASRVLHRPGVRNPLHASAPSSNVGPILDCLEQVESLAAPSSRNDLGGRGPDEGFGVSSCGGRDSRWIACFESATLLKISAPDALGRDLGEEAPTRLSQDALVGVKCSLKRRCLASHAFTSCVLWVP